MQLNLFAPFNTLSYGYVSSYILRELIRENVEISLHPIGAIQPEDKFSEYIHAGLARQKMFFHDAPCLKIFHQNCLEQWVGDGERIAFPIFELNKFNEIEKHHLSWENVDRVLTCSKWAKSVVDKELEYTKCSVVPLGVDTSVFTPKLNKRKTTVFFNCGKWEYRKGHDLLPEIFRQIIDEDFELWMMPSHGFMRDGEDWQWKEKYFFLGNKVRFIPPVENQTQAAYIMQQTDCGIFPTRAEGWGMPILEMMACGKHIITTNYSGQTEFCNPENSMLINIDKMELARDNKWFTDGDGEWACLDNKIDEIVSFMRSIIGKKELNDAGIATANKFTWQNTVNELLRVIDV
jgi:glycosyltransferase involved in cell wall biosynthesis